jgi:hypothetical protein
LKAAERELRAEFHLCGDLDGFLVVLAGFLISLEESGCPAQPRVLRYFLRETSRERMKRVPTTAVGRQYGGDIILCSFMVAVTIRPRPTITSTIPLISSHFRAKAMLTIKIGIGNTIRTRKRERENSGIDAAIPKNSTA